MKQTVQTLNRQFNMTSKQCYKYYVHPYEGHQFTVGQECFVRLRQGHSSRARILDGPFYGSTDEYTPDSDAKPTSDAKFKRFKIQYFSDNSIYHARESKLQRVFELPSVIITKDTDDYRHLARSQIIKTDRVVEFGSSLGLCTKALSENAETVLGLDNSELNIERSRAAFPELNFELVDVLRRLPELQQRLEGFNKVFVDIGGDREVKALVRALYFVKEYLRPELIVVKSRVLFKSACREENDKSDIGLLTKGQQWWENLFITYCGLAGILPYPEKWFVEAKSAGFTAKPLSYPWRETVDGTPICRLYNYSICLKHLECLCEFDHDHCHHCGKFGHRAIECDFEHNE
jgi:predicted O-methyltransferase YrrM